MTPLRMTAPSAAAYTDTGQIATTAQVFDTVWRELPALADLKLEHVVLEAGSPAVGQSLASLALRHRTGALVVALQHLWRLLNT